MGRVLFGSEFGANLGHIYPMLRIADRLAENGHQIIFAVRNLQQTKQALKGRGYQILQAPYWQNPRFRQGNIATPSYSDVMARQGFGFKDTFAAFFTAWSDLADVVKPDLIIADHSPGLSIAVRGRHPMINMGNGFTLPPSQLETYPSVIAKGAPLVRQDWMRQMFNEVLTENNRPQLEFLPQIFDTEGQYVCTVPHLDPYAQFRTLPQVGPLEDSLDCIAPPKSPHVFVYMAHGSGAEATVLATLKTLNVKSTAFVRGAPAKTIDTFHGGNLQMLNQPADFADILPRASLVIHSGGGGTSTACLMTGRPQITFPSHSETSLNSRLMHQQGVAQPVRSTVSQSEMTALLEKVLSNDDMKQASERVAIELNDDKWKQALPTILNHAEEIIAR